MAALMATILVLAATTLVYVAVRVTKSVLKGEENEDD